MIPTITSITPNRIYTGGQLVVITGTGFQTKYPIDPATPHPWPTPAPTVSVTVGGRSATKIKVLSSTRVECRIPPVDLGAVSITLKNLAEDGTPITGETVTTSNRLVAVRVDLAVDSDLSRLIDTFVLDLRRQVLENVTFYASVDFESEPDALEFAGVDFAKLPALAIQGPSLNENRFYGELRPEVRNADGSYSRRSTFRTVDVSFRINGLTNHTRQFLNLQALVTQYFKTNNYLVFQRDASDVSKGFVQYEVEATDFNSASINSTNDLRVFYGTATIKGFQFEDVPGFPTQIVQENTGEISDISILVEQISR
jgi:hypothetical protein